MNTELKSALEYLEKVKDNLYGESDIASDTYDNYISFIRGDVKSFETPDGILYFICFQDTDLIFKFQGANYILPGHSDSYDDYWDFDKVAEVELKEKLIKVWEAK